MVAHSVGYIVVAVMILVAAVAAAILGLSSQAPATGGPTTTNLATSITSSSAASGSSGSSVNMSAGAAARVTVLRGNITVTGLAGTIPCNAMHLPCIDNPHLAVHADLIQYNGSTYYRSIFSVGKGNPPVTTSYEIWYTNSTYYCISPKLDWANACPA